MAFVIVTGRIIKDNTGTIRTIPVLLSTEGPIHSVIDYCLTVRRSLSWQEKLVRAVRMFLQYLEKNQSPKKEEWKLFRDFVDAMYLGTIDSSTGYDPSGLYWQGINNQDAKYYITLLTDFFDWLGRNDKPRALAFNPQYEGNEFDKKIDKQAYLYRRNSSLLGHSWSVNSSKKGRVTKLRKEVKSFENEPPAFPENRIEELIFKGFKHSDKYDYRGMAITCLLLGGGLRPSEPFHMYMADVHQHWERSGSAFVCIHHPSLGYAPDNWKTASGTRGNREQYLSHNYGLSPRHLIRGKKHAGWKNPALDRHWYMYVHWFPQDFYGQLFHYLWSRYLEETISIPRNHPFAWINYRRNPIGSMYTVSSFQKAFQAAIEKIGLIYGKRFGTSLHGPRHAYGQRTREGKIDRIIVQRMMHHRSPDSQLVYKQPKSEDVLKEIEKAEKIISKNYKKNLFDF